MKHIYSLSSAILIFLFFSIGSYAQLQLPAPSPKASVSQTVGLTDISIEYSSPGAKGRTIFGDLVPYDAIWRTGANSATKITFSKDVNIAGTKVSKGTYSIFTIPGKTEWTIIINKNANASTSEYKQAEDAVRLTAKAEVAPMRERMAFQIVDFDDSKGTVSLEWDKVRVGFTVECATDEQALENIKSSLGGTWRTYNSAARYMLEKKDYETALKYANQSIQLTEDWFNVWVKASILSKMNKNKEAYDLALKAKTLGDKNVEGFFFKTQVEEAIAKWPKQ
ncbi:MAG: DUF2911 domain-containing protein [Bacteroidetes bacterium]|nr:MAG: DUF2911 domain-containing protein [Bacteroidota bacterium]